MEDELKTIEATLITSMAATYGHPSVAELTAERDRDIQRLRTQSPVNVSAEDIRDRLRSMLVLSIELMGEHYEEPAWSSGVEGAILHGRLSILRETLDWITNGAV